VFFRAFFYQDICVAAIKEREIEINLQRVIAEWNLHTFKLATYKSRGELLLRVDTTNNILTMLEDSLIILMSMLNSR
jgi:dynein heavy chain